MLTFLKITNIALIDELEIEFGRGLNLLTGETGSGKSIIVDSLGALTGERVTTDLIKDGASSAQLQGLFSVAGTRAIIAALGEGGIELSETSGELEIIIRRELSRSGKNRIFVNNQLVTQSFLKKIGEYLADIHSQGEQAALFDARTHIEMLDKFAGLDAERANVVSAFRRLADAKDKLAALQNDEADKLQLLDILKFQVNEISTANLSVGEIDELTDEKRRLNNVEKLSALSDEAYELLYESDQSTLSTFDRAAKKIIELGEYDSLFAAYIEQIEAARAVIEDMGATARDFRHRLEFSPERLEEIETRLAEISRVIRKYGGTVESTLKHLAESAHRLANIETAEQREADMRAAIAECRASYIASAAVMHEKRRAASKKFEKDVTANLKAVALDKAKFEVRIDSPVDLTSEEAEKFFTTKGFDRIEFHFSANPGETPKPLARVVSGGEASRLMLILKTTGHSEGVDAAAVFDEVDTGIGGRIAEAVGQKLKQLSRSQQVFCVTHQPQIASLADRHYLIEKRLDNRRATITVRELSDDTRVEEIARMLAGEKITEAARQNALEMLRRDAVKSESA